MQAQLCVLAQTVFEPYAESRRQPTFASAAGIPCAGSEGLDDTITERVLGHAHGDGGHQVSDSHPEHERCAAVWSRQSNVYVLQLRLTVVAFSDFERLREQMTAEDELREAVIKKSRGTAGAFSVDIQWIGYQCA